MRSLYLRIYLTVLVALALFALASGGLLQSHFEQERERMRDSAQERFAAWGELLQRALPGADAPPAEQAAALNDWSARLRIALALDDASGRRIGESDSYRRLEAEDAPRRGQSIALIDGRTLRLMRAAPMRLRAGDGAAPGRMHPPGRMPWWPWWPSGGIGLAALLLVIFAAVALGAWPVVRRLTRRLEDLKRGVEAFGGGALHRRVAEDGRDEVAALGASFNQAAGRIEALLRAQQSLLANASHELRSPLARLKMAVAMIEDAPPEQRERLRREIHANIGELDALVEEVLMASRLDAGAAPLKREPVELLALVAEEASRIGASAEGDSVLVNGDERLLRRALRNLLENARRYGGGRIEVRVRSAAPDRGEVSVCDDGPGVPEAYRDRVFEAFFRLPGHAEHDGGVGLGLALVRQIAQAHGGSVRCSERSGGGSCFALSLPAA